MGSVHVDLGRRSFGGEHAIRVANDSVELVLSTDYGPRVLCYALRDRDNVFGFVSPESQGNPTPFGEDWHIYGGHRLWHAPEDPVRSYVPDNGPVLSRVEHERKDQGGQDGDVTVVLTRPEEPLTSLVKELRVTLSAAGSGVRVDHRITNAASAPIELAVWGLSLMTPGGTAIFPNPPFIAHPQGLLPARRLVLWPYTWLGDPRFRLGPRFLRLRQDPRALAPQKVGLYDEDHGSAAYACNSGLFVKRSAVARPSTVLADLGCNLEAFTNAEFLELETLGPMVRLMPGETTSHLETWHLETPIRLPDDDDETAALLQPLLEPRARKVA